MGWLLIGPEWYANVSGVNPGLLRLLLERPTRISPECITRELQEPATGSGQRLRRKRICLESITRELQEPANWKRPAGPTRNCPECITRELQKPANWKRPAAAPETNLS